MQVRVVTKVIELYLKPLETVNPVSQAIFRAVDAPDCPRKSVLGLSCVGSGYGSNLRSRSICQATMLSCNYSLYSARSLDVVSGSLVLCRVLEQSVAPHCHGICLRIGHLAFERKCVCQTPNFVAAVAADVD